MLALLAAVLVSTPYVPVTCQAGYVATYRGGRVQCVNSILQSTTSGAATSAATATTALGLTCSGTCVQDSEIQSLDVIKTTGWPTCNTSIGQVLTASGSPPSPVCTSVIRASDVSCTGCIAAGEISSFDFTDANDTAAGELYEHHASSTITLSETTGYYQWTTSTAGVCERMTCAEDSLTISLDGAYRVSASFSGSINSANQIVEMDLFLNGSEVEKCGISAKFTSVNDEKAMSWTCLLYLVREDVLTLRFQNTTSSGKVLTIQHVNLNASRVW